MENFNANGQLVFVEPDWITGKTCLFTVTNNRDYITGMVGLTKIRKEFIKRLESEGFIITHDKHDNQNDIIYLNMNNEAINNDNEDISEYKRLLDERIFIAGGEKLNYPHSMKFVEYLKNPFYPAVLKNELMNGGKDKFFIETPEQLAIVKKFYEKYKDDERLKPTFDCSIFQQFIKTPTDHKTYMRVLMSASGDVLGASLKYSKASIEVRPAAGTYEKFFWDKNSEFYLNCKGMFNYYSGGGNIIFGQNRLNYEEREILSVHGIDPDNPTVPEEVLEVSSNISVKCNREIGILCGLDFIYNEEDQKWYYLEMQAFPAIDEWAIPRKIKVREVRDIKDYIKMNALDLEARYEALMLCMEKKRNLNKDSLSDEIITRRRLKNGI